MKITRQNLYRPTALIHETGTRRRTSSAGTRSSPRLLGRELAAAPELAATWSGWSSEIAADTYAFALTGYGSVAALHDVVSGGASVFREIPGDPHPVAFLRVLLVVQMAVRFFGAGPWDDLGAGVAARLSARLGAGRDDARSSSARFRICRGSRSCAC